MSILNRLQLPLLVLFVIGFSAIITKYIVVNEISAYRASNPIPYIAVVDFEGFVTSQLKEGVEPTQVLKHVHMLTVAAMNDGYILLDKKFIAASAPEYALPNIPFDALQAALESKGLLSITDEAVKNNLAQAETDFKSSLQQNN